MELVWFANKTFTYRKVSVFLFLLSASTTPKDAQNA